MFFLYLAIFVVIVATPYMVLHGVWFFSEDDVEALILLLAGIVSFTIYRMRDYQVFQTLRDRVRLQRLFARAQKDLSESYSYIGHSNRRTDIMYEIFSDLSHMNADDYSSAVTRAMALLPYTNIFSFRFLSLEDKKSLGKINGTNNFKHLPDALFCKETQTRSYRHKDILFVYSDAQNQSLRTCIALPYSEKAGNDIEFFKALTAYFTMVYVVHVDSCMKKTTHV
ncbi:MAG: hypothetical protein WC819_01160 [Parcubacteria group bacterium]|jgi:hypothetical protein